jgi:hypothetical protein
MLFARSHAPATHAAAQRMRVRWPPPIFVDVLYFRKRRLFELAAVVEVVVAQILRAGKDCRGLSEDACLVTFVHRAKQMSGYHGAQVADSTHARPKGRAYGGRIWQTGYHDRVLRAHEEPRLFLTYIVNNPIRAGLVESVPDYPFTGSGVYTREQLWDYVGLDRVP